MHIETFEPNEVIITKDAKEVDFFAILAGEVEIRPKKDNPYMIGPGLCFENLKNTASATEWRMADVAATKESTWIILIQTEELDKVELSLQSKGANE